MTKRLLTSAALAAALATAAAAQSPAAGRDAGHGAKHEGKHAQGEHGHKQAEPSEQAAPVTLSDDETIKRGAAIKDGKSVDLSDVLKEPAKYADRVVVVQGVIKRVCQKQGCWIELAPEKGKRGVRVAMKEHAFFVPFNAAGLYARAEGTFAVKTLTREDADHFEKEGAKLTRNSDGTATEVSFTASGVELSKHFRIVD
jgi:hypothetical protein